MNVLRLQISGILLGFAVIGLLAFTSLGFAQDKIAGNTVLTTSPTPEYIVQGGMDTPIYVTPCEECGCCECGSSGHNGLRANLSATACFNCRTNGSYKFPVPRQYTYFWPGIYSQKTMTEYVAPFTGLKLRSPSEVFDGDLDENK
ncbi:MAG: hypothetical protein K6C40_15465 [Thermoguttaceae bacterium]|nr:hypothetical protein [Thermoguttaceae bacterium]